MAEQLPIPQDVQPGPYWTEQMLEMADHIGAYPTMLLVERFGGQRIYVPADWTRGKVYEGFGSIRDVIGDAAAMKLSAVYTREYINIPTAKRALDYARRQPLLAAVHSGDITGAEAARRLGTTRPYMSHLVNHTDEGTGALPAPKRATRALPGQMDMFSDED